MAADRTAGQTVDSGALTVIAPLDSTGGALATYRAGARIELTLAACIAAWLHENGRGRTVRADGTPADTRTSAAYAALLADYRAELAAAGLDLDSGDERALAFLAQAWAKRPRVSVDSRGRALKKTAGQPVSSATHNRRLAVVSSFYTFARRYDLPARVAPGEQPRTVSNPIDRVKRQRVQNTEAARPLEAGDVVARLAAIDRTTLAGARDFALLTVALNTGRRVAELAALEWRDVTLAAGQATITWRYCKGGKVMYDTLDSSITDALKEWMYAAYGAELGHLAPDAPLWLALSRNSGYAKGQRRAMTPQAIADVWAKRLGVSKVHATRHTFAVNMDALGAPLTEIQKRLGHANAATTGRYMERQMSAANPFAAELAALYGLRPAPAKPRPAPRSGPRSPRSRVTKPLIRE